MKIKRNIYIHNNEQFLRDPNSDCYATAPDRHMDNSWEFVAEVEFDVNVDTSAMIESVSADIDEKIAELHTAIQVAEIRKAELLALPAPDLQDAT